MNAIQMLDVATPSGVTIAIATPDLKEME